MTRQRLRDYNRLALLDHLLSPRVPGGPPPCARWEKLHAERVALAEALGYGSQWRPWLTPWVTFHIGEGRSLRFPVFKGSHFVAPADEIRRILATPDPGLFAGVLRHAAEASVAVKVEGEGVLLDLVRSRLDEARELN